MMGISLFLLNLFDSWKNLNIKTIQHGNETKNTGKIQDPVQ